MQPTNHETPDHGATAAAPFGIHRSLNWPDVAREHLARQPHCVCCRPDSAAHAVLQVHHIFPFHYCIALGRPDLELDERNLITLYGHSQGIGHNHHLWVGHLDDFQSSNLSVVRDARTTFRGMHPTEFKADARWLRRARRRLVPLELMGDDEWGALLEVMNRRMPWRCG